MRKERAPDHDERKIRRADKDDVSRPLRTVWVLRRQKYERAKVDDGGRVCGNAQRLDPHEMGKLHIGELTNGKDDADKCCVFLTGT